LALARSAAVFFRLHFEQAVQGIGIQCSGGVGEKLVEASVVNLSNEAGDSEVALFLSSESLKAIRNVVHPRDKIQPVLSLGTLVTDALLLPSLLARFYVRTVAALAWHAESVVFRCGVGMNEFTAGLAWQALGHERANVENKRHYRHPPWATR
jgi:hypothetical protein